MDLHGAGGELQRFALAVVALQKADIYMIDEPSSYLDVRQRLKAAEVSLHLNIISICPFFGEMFCAVNDIHAMWFQWCWLIT